MMLAVDTMPGLVREAAARYGPGTALADGPVRVSYAELLERVRAAARAYLAVGVRPGDRVAIWARNRVEFAVALLGAEYLGAAVVPLNTRFRGHEAAQILARSRAVALIVDDGFLGTDYLGMLRVAAAEHRRDAADDTAGGDATLGGTSAGDTAGGDATLGGTSAGDTAGGDTAGGGSLLGGIALGGTSADSGAGDGTAPGGTAFGETAPDKNGAVFGGTSPESASGDGTALGGTAGEGTAGDGSRLGAVTEAASDGRLSERRGAAAVAAGALAARRAGEGAAAARTAARAKAAIPPHDGTSPHPIAATPSDPTAAEHATPTAPAGTQPGAAVAEANTGGTMGTGTTAADEVSARAGAAGAVSARAGAAGEVNARAGAAGAVSARASAAGAVTSAADAETGPLGAVDALASADGGAVSDGPVVGLPYLRVVVELGGEVPDGAIGWAPFLAAGESVPERDAEAAADAVRPDTVCDVLFTSGTTGAPKGVMSSHRQTLSVAAVWARGATLTPHDRYAIVNPFFHSFGYKAGLIAAITGGATIYPVPTFDPEGVLALIQRERITVLPGAPTIFTTLINHPKRETYDLSSLRFSIAGAASVPENLFSNMREILGFDQVAQAYGLTECVVATQSRPDEDPQHIAETTGPAVAGLEIRIVAPDGSVQPPGSDGEIQIRGANVMLGYFEDPEATAAAIDPDGWLHTGDQGRKDEHGCVTITGRIKDMFIVGGFNVYPAEVENVLANHPDVMEAAVVGVADERLGAVGRAYVIGRPDSAPDPEELVAFARERLANFKVPREIVFLDALPRNAAGKVLKRDLSTD